MRANPDQPAIEWSPTLVRRQPIAGVVVGAPMKSAADLCFVTLLDEATWEPEETKELAPDGSFRFSQPLADRYRIVVLCEDADVPERPARFAWLDGARPGDVDLQVVLTDIDQAAEIRGRLLATETAHAAIPGYESGFEIDLVHEELGWVAAVVPDADGSFHFTGVQPDRYHIEVHRAATEDEALRFAEVPLHVSDVIELTPGEVRDLGPLRPEFPGRLIVRLDQPEGIRSLDGLRLRIPDVAGEGTVDYLQRSGLEAVSGALPPGSYRLEIDGHPFVTGERRFTIEPGLETVLDLELSTGVRITCRVGFDRRDGRPAGPLRATLKDSSGALVADLLESPQPQGNEYFVKVVLPAGRYTLDAKLEDGRTTQTLFDVDPAHGHRIIDVEIR